MVHSLTTIIRECYGNRRQMLSISAYNLRIYYIQTRLRLLWTLLDPTLQAATYWIAYHVGMRIQSPIEDVPYLAWMLTGLIPWFFISAVLTSGGACMISASGIILNMKYPLATIPVGTILTEMLKHCCSIAVLMVVQIGSGVRYSWGVLWVFYYMLCAFAFLMGYTFFVSTLNVFVRDIQKIIQVGVRLLFFLTPICWSVASRSNLEVAMRWNPFAFIIEGYRGAMLHHGQFNLVLWQHTYFWAISLLLILVGGWLHVTFREQFSDYL